jgi:predicted ATP-dependent endonuclease of OLD family
MDEMKADDTKYKILSASVVDLSKIIRFKYISARRDTVNKDNDGTLSSLSGRYYEKTKADDENAKIQQFEDALVETDFSLTDIYQGLFEGVIKKVKKFGGIRENETVVKIISTLSQQQLLKGNTTVVYESEKHQLPESYNGLGYLNLISMIIEIETLLSEFRNDRDAAVIPADINILFIEEPEAHTHPQMQYVFIKNIKNLLEEGTSGSNNKKPMDLQTIITTHSSHIVSECDFDDIKYFQRITETRVISKNLKDLEIEYKDEKDPNSNHFKFLKQYLTLNYSEVFFADKVILYEGETERIMIPAMMKKIDEEDHDDNEAPLLSQNISLIESGAYAQIFDAFLSFINAMTLIITDIDSGKQKIIKDKNGVERKVSIACPVEEGSLTTNSALKHYYKILLEGKKDENPLAVFKGMPAEEKILINKDGKWVTSSNGNLMLVFQTNEGGTYYPRSFEDAFIQINREFISAKLSQFRSLQCSKKILELGEDSTYSYNAFDIAKDCIKSKASFAMDILLNSEENGKQTYSNWKTPEYIKEGLLWLRKG